MSPWPGLTSLNLHQPHAPSRDCHDNKIDALYVKCLLCLIFVTFRLGPKGVSPFASVPIAMPAVVGPEAGATRCRERANGYLRRFS